MATLIFKRKKKVEISQKPFQVVSSHTEPGVFLDIKQFFISEHVIGHFVYNEGYMKYTENSLVNKTLNTAEKKIR